jgi:hypothetical protein
MAVLAIMERAYRGAVETQYADLPFVLRDLHRQLGGMVVLLRGVAVTLALDGPDPVPLRLGGTTLDTLPDRRHAVRGMLEDGIAVHVDEQDLVAAGLTVRRLLPGVRPAGPHDLPWADYDHVWFL